MKETHKLVMNPLFASITDVSKTLHEIVLYTKRYKKGEFIFSIGDQANCIGLLSSGEAHVLQLDYWGNQSILTILQSGELFAEAFACSNVSTIPVQVIAVQECEVVFTSYANLANATNALTLLQNLCIIMANKNVQMAQKMEILSKRTSREKILTYFTIQAIRENNTSFLLPFNRQQLADYLCMDRSALSRELSHMQQEGFIKFHKNQFLLRK